MKQINKTLKTSAVAVAAALALVACGGGGGGSAGGAGTTVSGVVSGGAFQQGALVKLCGATGGCTATQVAGAGGAYAFTPTDLGSITKPYLIQASFGGNTYYAVATESSGSTANINAATSIAAMLALGSNISTVMSGTGTALSSVNMTSAYSQVTALVNAIAAAMGESGVSTTGESSFLSSSLTEGSGLDKVLAQLEVSMTGGLVTVTNNGTAIAGFNGVSSGSASGVAASNAVAGALKIWDEAGLIGQTGLVAWLQSVFQNGGTTTDPTAKVNCATVNANNQTLFTSCSAAGVNLTSTPVSGTALSGTSVTLTGLSKHGNLIPSGTAPTYIIGRDISLLWTKGSTTGRLYFKVKKTSEKVTAWTIEGFNSTTAY